MGIGPGVSGVTTCFRDENGTVEYIKITVLGGRAVRTLARLWSKKRIGSRLDSTLYRSQV